MFNISIVTFTHELDDLRNCISSIFAQNEPVQLVVVDNLNSSAVKDYIASLPDVLYYCLSNPGFGAAHNSANAHFHVSGYRVFLNPDIEMSPFCLTNLRIFFENNQDYALVSPILYNRDGSMQRIIRKYPSIFELIKRKLTGSSLELEPDFVGGVCRAEFLHGAFFVINRGIPNEQQSYDPRYFMYLEDFDLCIALRRLGKIGVVQAASAIHTHGRGSRKHLRLFATHLRSILKFWKKHGYFYD